VVLLDDISLILRRFFQQFTVLLPILDPAMTPNECYELAPFLFWAVIGVGCRAYPRNPTLLPALSNKIQTMALMTLNAPVTLPVIHGMLLFLNWPFPKPSSHSGHDLTFPLSAALLHMAMCIGIHQPVASQEFSKVRVKLSEEDLKMRAETWGHCTLVYQR
jgi:hypothetical protein